MNSKKLPLLILYLSILIASIHSHPQRLIENPPMNIVLATSQSLFIKPNEYMHNKFFTVTTALKEDLRYIEVDEAKIQFVQQFNSILPHQTRQTTFEELRTRTSSVYRHLEVFSNFIMAVEKPNLVLSFQKKNGEVSMKSNYTIHQLSKKTETKLYKFNVSSALLVPDQGNTFYFLGEYDYLPMKLEKSVAISHLQIFNQDTVITAEYQNGIKIYKLDIQSKRVQEIGAFSCQDLMLDKKCSISDIDFSRKKLTLYVLEVYSGVYKYPIEQEMGESGLVDSYRISQEHEREEIILIQGCEIMDFLSYDHFVLICKNQQTLSSYLLEVIEVESPILGTTTYIKKDPMYHPCNFQELLVTDDYYIAYNRYSFDIFWNSIANGLFMTEIARTSNSMSGLQTFKFVEQANGYYLYAIRGNFLISYKMQVNSGSIKISSPEPVYKTIELLVNGLCPQLLDKQNKLRQNQQNSDKYHNHPTPTFNNQFEIQQCVYSQKLYLMIQQRLSSQHLLSISLGLIVLMILIMVILVCICYTKYSSMQDYLRNMINKYKKKNRELRKIEI